MKALLLLLLTVILLPAQSIQRTLAWDYTSPLTPDMVFRVHSSTNPAIPILQWPVVATITNMVTTTTNTPVIINLPAEFFVVSVSNAVDMVFSEVLEARKPVSGTNLRLR